MKAVILAGGLGKRLRPLTEETPKPLLPIGESTTIELAIKRLKEHGVGEIFLATRYKAEKVESFLGDGSRYGVKLHYSVEDQPLGTCGPLSLLKDHLNEPFILMNGDVLTKLDFGAVVRFARKKKAELTVVTKEDVLNYRYGVVRAEGDRVTGIEEKPSLSNEVLTGIYVVSPKVFDVIPENRSYGIDELINDLLAKGRRVTRYVTDAYWRDVGEIESLHEANQEYAVHFGDGKAPPPKVEERPPSRSLSEVWASIESSLQTPAAIILTLFALATVHYVLKNTVSYGETQTLMYAKQFAEPEFLPEDWYLNRSQPVRVPYQVLIYPLIKLFPLYLVSPLARILGYLCVAVGLGLVAHRLRINALYAGIALGIFLWIDQSLLPGEEWILKRAESKVIAYGLVLFALHALLERRLRWAGAFAGAATTFHILVGGWATAALGLTVLSQRLGSTRERLVALGCWCGTALYAIGCVLAKLWEPPGPEGFDATFVWADFRNPHYVKVAEYWDLLEMNSLFFVILLGVLWWAPAAMRHERQDYAVASRFALWTLAPFALGLAVQPFAFGAKLLHYMPFRVADTLIPLLGLLIAVQILLRRLVRPPANMMLAIVLAAFSMWTAWDGLQSGLRFHERYPVGGYWSSRSDTWALYETCDWVKNNTSRGAVMIVSPKINVIPYLCERPVVVTFRDVPSGAADLAEWYRRLVDFNGGEEPEETGYAARSEIDDNFNRLTTEAYLDLGEKYDGRYLLVQDNDDVELPLLFQEGDWALYDLRPDEGR